MTSEQLKNSILQFAVQGKLVPQNPHDEPASELLKKIKAEKEKLLLEKKIRKEKHAQPITDDEKPFEIPDSWEWVRLSEVGVYKKGPFGSSLTKSMFVPKGINSIKVYEQKNAIYKNHLLGDYYIKKEYFETKMKGFEVFPNDILVSCAGTIGETYIVPEDAERGIINQALMIMKITNEIQFKYFLLYFDYVLKKTAQISSSGSAIKNIPPFDIFKNLLFPLPPLAEQQRIVDKIEELLPLVEQYGTAEQELRQLNTKFPEQLKKSVLQYAVQGKLVPQNLKDEPASILLEKIKAEKKQLIKEKKIKQDKPLPEIKEDEIPFEIPDSWLWVRLGEIVTIKGGKRVSNGYQLLTTPTPYIYIRVSDMKNGTISDSNLHYLDENMYQLIKQYTIGKDDIYMTIVGATIGKCGIVPEKFHNMNLTENAAKITPILIDKMFLLMCLNSAFCQNQFIDKTNQVGVQKMALNRFTTSLIPLPPLSEQKLIVEKVEEVLGYCDKLK